jgi:hypothetical protein
VNFSITLLADAREREVAFQASRRRLRLIELARECCNRLLAAILRMGRREACGESC